jgi:hypothetical protein
LRHGREIIDAIGLDIVFKLAEVRAERNEILVLSDIAGLIKDLVSKSFPRLGSEISFAELSRRIA